MRDRGSEKSWGGGQEGRIILVARKKECYEEH